MAAQITKLGKPTVYRWIKLGHVPCRIVQVSRIRVRLKDVEQYLEVRRQAERKPFSHYQKMGRAAAAMLRSRRAERERKKLAKSWTRQEEDK